VVDDEAMVRDAIKRLLEHGGCDVEAVDSGEAALNRLALREFDVVITDFSMPGMQGDQLVARIREMLPAQRITMATAFVEEYKIFGQRSASVDFLLLKPFSFKELYQAVEQVLEPGHQLDDGVVPPIPDRPPTQDFIPPAER